MKTFSYTCHVEKVEEVRATLISLGANVFKQVQMFDVETTGLPISLIKLVFVVDNETELLLKLKFPSGTLIDCSA
jgi:hypothetical protein